MKNINSIAIAAIVLTAVTILAPVANAKGGAAIAPVKQVKTIGTKYSGKEGVKLVRKAALQQPLKVAQLDKKSAAPRVTKSECAKGAACEKKTVKTIAKTPAVAVHKFAKPMTKAK